MKLSLEALKELTSKEGVDIDFNVDEDYSVINVHLPRRRMEPSICIRVENNEGEFSGHVGLNRSTTKLENAEEIFNELIKGMKGDITEEDLLSVINSSEAIFSTPAEKMVEGMTRVIELLNDKELEAKTRELVSHPTLKLTVLGILEKAKALKDFIK